MKTMRTLRFFGAVMCAVFLVALLVCCTEPTSQTNETTAAVTEASAVTTAPESTAVDYFRNLPEALFFPDSKFTILTYDSETWDLYLDPDQGEGSTLNIAAYSRNLAVETKLGVSIETVKKPHANIIKEISATNSSGKSEYELVCFWATTNLASLLTENQVYDWKKLDHIDLNSDWYNQTANDAFYIAGKQYLAVSDLTYTVQQHFRFLCNLDLLSAKGLEAPYQSVYDGKWTYEKLLEYTKDVYTDNNNDGKKDKDDSYGFATSINGVSRFVNNWGESPVKAVDNGFELNIMSDKLVSVVEKMNALINDGGTFASASGNEHYTTFSSGNALFEVYSSDPALLLESLDFKYGYLPYPKYNEEQKNYITVTHGGIMAVPITISDVSFTGAVIEALSATSAKYIEPAFINVFIESRVLQDADSIRMYRLMRDTAFYEVARNIDPAGCFSGLSYYTKLLKENNSNLAGRYAELEKTIRTGYNDIFNNLLNND